MDKKAIEGVLMAGIGVAVGLIIYQMLKPTVEKVSSKIGGTAEPEEFEEDLVF